MNNTSSPQSVLLLDGETRTCLAVVRSLGEKGYKLTVSSHSGDALALKSRYANTTLLSPDPNTAPVEFIQWLQNTCKSGRFDILLPLTDLSLELTYHAQEKFPSELRVLMPHRDTYLQANNKILLLHAAKELGVRIPDTVIIPPEKERTDATIAEIESFTYGAVLKPAFSVIYQNSFVVRAPVTYVNSPLDVMRVISGENNSYYRFVPFLLQQQVVGAGVGVFGMFFDGEPVATFCHRRILEKPPTGGVSVLSESIPESAAPVEAALKLTKHFRWKGVCMVEFKRDTDGKDYLMEINPRFWGSLQLAIDSGRDFPAYLLELFGKSGPMESRFVQEIRDSIQPYKTGLRLRWEFGTLDHLWIRLKTARLKTLQDVITRNALCLFQSPNTRLEIFRSDDPHPFMSELWGFLKRLFRKRPASSKF